MKNPVESISRTQANLTVFPYIIIYCAVRQAGCIFFCIVHLYPPFTRKRIVSLYFGLDVRTRLGVAISEVSGPPVFHIKAGASR